MTGLVLDVFGGPGGWAEGARALGITELGIEWDAAACATRAAAGHKVIRADAAKFPAGLFAGDVTGLIASAPCTTFSAAGRQAGNAVLAELSALIRDLAAGRPTRARHRKAMACALRRAWWPDPKLTRAERSARIWKAVRSASLVAEPARFIQALRPEWVALEQVPSVLPLWRVYQEELMRLGYSCWIGKLNAANYGVPQTRERAILIASRVRRVSCPPPTHYDARKGAQLWGEPWISMATALGWGATGRAAPTVTAGGTAAGGAEPFGHRDRDALEADRDAGEWVLRAGNQPHAAERPAPAPAPAIAFGHNAASCQWVLRTSFGEPKDAAKNGTHEMDPAERPAHTVTGKTRNWELHTNRGQEPDGTRQTADPSTALTAKSGGQRKVKSFRNNNNNNACERSLDEPAGTLFFGGRSNWAAWVTERPATCVQGDPPVGRPGHKYRERGESQFETDSVRITVQEAAILQSFRPDYPWQGTRTKQFEQVGNAVPPRLAMHVLAEATGMAIPAELREAS